MPESPRISVAVPLFNEEQVLDELLRRLGRVLDGLPGGPHQIVFADDGSSDGTAARLAEAARLDPRITVVRLSRNFGHQAALTAALDFVAGDVIVAMDGDLQDPPESIPQLLERHREGYDVVYVTRGSRPEGWLLRTCYAGFYRGMGLFANLQLPADAGDFCLLSRNVLDVLRTTRESHRYLRGLRAWAGFRQTGLVIPRAARHAGESKYSWRKLFQLAFDGLFSFSTLPLRLATLLGLATTAFTFLLGCFWLAAKFLGYSPQGFTALAASIAFFSGVQLLFIGVIGEYVGRIYEEVKRRPLYVVQRVWNAPVSTPVPAPASVPVPSPSPVPPAWTPPTPSPTGSSTSATGGGAPASEFSATR